MNAVFSKKGFIGLCKQNQHESFDDIIHLLKKDINFKLAFTKRDLETLQGKNKTVVYLILKKLSRNRGDSDKFEWGYIIPNDILDRNYSKLSFDELSSLYFLDKKKAQPIIQDDRILCAYEGTEISTIERIFVKETESSYTYSIHNELDDDWNVLKSNITPTSDVIITDGFLFGRGESYYDKNFLRIIGILIDGKSSKPKNLVIFTFIEVYDKYSKEIHKTNAIGILKRIQTLYNEKSLTPPKVTIVLMPQGTKHERMIITNYKRYIGGDSFNLYNTEGEVISKDENLTVSNYAQADSSSNIKDYLRRLQQLITPLNQFGDGESNFLKLK